MNNKLKRRFLHSSYSRSMILESILLTFKRLHPLYLTKNPVLFVVFMGGTLTTLLFIRDVFYPPLFLEPLWFTGSISFWLWFTLLFANASEVIAEGKGKAHASTLKALAQETIARRVLDNGTEELVPASQLRREDHVRILAGELVPADGEIIEGIAAIDESAITGESAPVIRESESDLSSVIAGTRVLSNTILVRIVSNPGESFLDHMIHLVLSARRQKTPNEIALQILLIGLTLVFVIVCSTLVPLGIYANNTISLTIIASLLVCLIPTTIGGLVAAIGISGIERALQKNILAMSGKAVETAGDIDVLLLDKTGTITLGNRMPVELIPFENVDMKDLAKALQLSSYADHTPEGRSILDFVVKHYGNFVTDKDLNALTFIPFSAETRMSGCDIDGYFIRKGACDAIKNFAKKMNLVLPHDCTQISEEIGRKGGTPLVVLDKDRVLGVVYLKDIKCLPI